MIELESVSKVIDGRAVVDRLSFRVEAGELVVLLGASGSGKTTTLKMINRLIEPTRGVIRIAGEDSAGLPGHALRRRVGYSFQEVGLFPHFDVAANIGITPALLEWPAERTQARVEALLELVELDPAEFAGRRPDTLSGGQAQRVGIARALAAEPEVLLMDEPFGALDPLTRDRLRRRFQTIQKELGVTTVLVTHDMIEALVLGDRIAILDGGSLLQIGEPRVLMREPADPRVAALLDAPRRELEHLRHLSDEGR